MAKNDGGGGFLDIFGGIVGGIGGLFGLFGGDDETVQGLTLPPELEHRFLSEFMEGLTRMNESYKQLTTVIDAYDERMASLDAFVAGQIPPEEAQKRIAETGTKIAEAFGGSALEAIEAGFLDKESAKISGLIEEREGELHDTLTEVEAADFRDPALEQQLQKQRVDLEQRLARAGASPAMRAQALREFEQGAETSRFQRTEELRTGKTQRAIAGFQAGIGGLGAAAGTRFQARQMGLQEASTGFRAQQDYVGGLARLGTEVATARFGGGLAGEQAKAGVRTERLGAYESMGKYDLRYAGQGVPEGQQSLAAYEEYQSAKRKLGSSATGQQQLSLQKRMAEQRKKAQLKDAELERLRNRGY